MGIFDFFRGSGEIEELKEDIQEDLNRIEKKIDLNSDRIEKLENDVEENIEGIEELSEETVSKKELREVESRIRDLEPITGNLTDREREMVDVFLQNQEYLSVGRIAEEMNTSRNNAGSILSNLKKKIDLDSKTLENNKKKYRLPEKQKQEILGNR